MSVQDKKDFKLKSGNLASVRVINGFVTGASASSAQRLNLLIEQSSVSGEKAVHYVQSDLASVSSMKAEWTNTGTSFATGAYLSVKGTKRDAFGKPLLVQGSIRLTDSTGEPLEVLQVSGW